MSAALLTNACFDVYGLRLVVQGDWPDVVSALRKDFAWFDSDESSAAPDFKVTLEPELGRDRAAAWSALEPLFR